MSPPSTARRSFIRHFALSTAVSMLGGKLWTARVLADIGPFGEPFEPVIINLSDYPALLNPNGSVRFRFAGIDGGSYPFVLSRADETTFYAVDTRCTHAGCTVNPFESTLSVMRCDCHGSEYDIMGRVITGPAVNDLIRYQLQYNGLDKVTVIIPGLDLSIRSVAVQEKTASAMRLRLDFPTIAFGRYKILFRQNLEDAPVGMLFAVTPTDPATLTVIDTDGSPQTVYVDAALPRGFFSVALVVEEI